MGKAKGDHRVLIAPGLFGSTCNFFNSQLQKLLVALA